MNPWRALAEHHRATGNEAQLALTDRRETDDAEHEAKEAAEAAREARLRAAASSTSTNMLRDLRG